MKKLHPSTQGFGHIALLLVLAVIAVIAIVGYRVVKTHENSTVANNIPASTVSYPTEIKNKTDLTQAVNALKSSTIGSSLDPSQLSTDLNNLY